MKIDKDKSKAGVVAGDAFSCSQLNGPGLHGPFTPGISFNTYCYLLGVCAIGWFTLLHWHDKRSASAAASIELAQDAAEDALYQPSQGRIKPIKLPPKLLALYNRRRDLAKLENGRLDPVIVDREIPRLTATVITPWTKVAVFETRGGVISEVTVGESLAVGRVAAIGRESVLFVSNGESREIRLCGDQAVRSRTHPSAPPVLAMSGAGMASASMIAVIQRQARLLPSS